MFKRRRLTIQMKTAEQIELMRAAGLLVGRTLELLREAVKPGMSTLDLDALAERHIRDNGGVPSFKGYHGFTGTICASVNEEIVHGIPRADKILREGDVLSIDCGAIVEGWHGDAAITVPVGEITDEERRLLEVTEASLWRGLAAGRAGARLTDISHAIEAHIRSQGPYGIVEGYGGHGIGTEMHMDPLIPNHGAPGHGPVLEPGMCFAVEPMVNLGTKETAELDDGWTVVTTDGRASAHFEHTFAVTADGPRVLTALDEGRDRFAKLGSAPQNG
ncbi:type I methionyl aminopeptidase [Actinomadura citrea]|jgi:methionyl aminopeptidase|uniref:Methionine aminopeptidase n=1 Tax=Actinomadura citrea TaxID=46158 RepID=A0A7Y9GIV3_9ACTN|nr:type I methionyl aminopeptidase [Actinomadura citrea]NYE17292.1 methionyl aminopeptidase [Actinomadura citrea]GGT93007.1 methionine aminopeptidase [Actinomadura citrea]